MRKTQRQIIKELERLLQIKEETIKELEKQNQILRNQPQPTLPINPAPFAPINPSPFVPVNPTPWNPQIPWGQPPYTITSGSMNSDKVFTTTWNDSPTRSKI